MRADLRFATLYYSGQAGIELGLRALADAQGCPLSRIATLSPAGDSLDVRVGRRGQFCLIESTARRGRAMRAFEAMVGGVPDSSLSLTVNLGDRRAGLTVADNARLHGPVSVGAAGVRSERLKGRRFRGTFDVQLDSTDQFQFPSVDGAQIRRSVSKDLERASQCLADGRANCPGNPDAVVDRLSVKLDTVLFEGNLTLRSATLPRGSTIIASGLLTLDDVTGTDLLFIGKSVRIANSSFTGQVVAEHRASLAATRLSYPSVVVVAGDSTSTDYAVALTISDHTRIDGTVLHLDPGSSTVLSIDESSSVRGLVYTSGLLNSQGTIRGTAAPWRFYFYESPAHYYNWIRDGRHDNDRPSDYAVPVAIATGSKQPIYVTETEWRRF